MSHAKMWLYWSVIHYQMIFERHSGCGSETEQGCYKTNNYTRQLCFSHVGMGFSGLNQY